MANMQNFRSNLQFQLKDFLMYQHVADWAVDISENKSLPASRSSSLYDVMICFAGKY